MFSGFTDETFEFFMAIRFNNNRDFFQANHDWYVRAVREPARALAGRLEPAVREIDPEVDARPTRVVCRPNRDTRFSRDKSPYRDYLFLAFRRPGEDRKSTMGMYFDLSDEGASFGAGFYDRNMPLMNALRCAILAEPERVMALTRAAERDFTLHGDEIKRMRVPERVRGALLPWYKLRGFYLEQEIRDFELIKSGRLADRLLEGYRALAPLYRYINSLTPLADPPA